MAKFKKCQAQKETYKRVTDLVGNPVDGVYCFDEFNQADPRVQEIVANIFCGLGRSTR